MKCALRLNKMVQTTVISFALALWLCSCCTVFGKTFSNSWAVKIRGGRVMLERLARKHGFVNESQVVADYYVFVHKMVPVRSNSPSTHILEELLADPEVLWAEQQVLQPYKLHSLITFNDPKWNEQWYMIRDDRPTYNVLDVWKMGYTGKGVVVAVVDEGLEKDHKELKQNFDPDASFDFIENDADPSSSDKFDSVSHGISCAGIIAAVPNNAFCGVGIAYSANIGGIRILQGELTDALKAKGLGFRQDYIDIYSNSWGPFDTGYEIGEVGVMTEKAIRQGALEGRNRRGSIFVFAGGNGGYVGDSCSFNGFVNSIYTIAITGVNKDGSMPRYGERCPGILAVTYSKEMILDRTKVITATHHGKCTDSFSASSAATAMASGLIALALEANKYLTWRDMQHIIIRSSRADGNIVHAKDWITNAANLTASNNVGFGLMDAYGLVSFAKNWTTVPLQLNCTISHPQIDRVIPSDVLMVSTSLGDLSHLCPGNKINFLEHVQVRINLNYTRRGDLEINLTSPSGTTSRLTHYRRKDGASILTNWKILTLHHWGENPSGVWKLTLKNSQLKHKNTGMLFDWALILYGTATDPLERNSQILIPSATRPVTYPTTPATSPTTPATSPTEPTNDASGISDIDECAVGTHSCSSDAVCINTKESYNCKCKLGYYGDGRNCTVMMDSVIISNNGIFLYHLARFLAPVVGNNSQWKLCYRASIHTQYDLNFHKKCDGKNNTVTIIKKNEYVFGGFTDIPWEAIQGIKGQDDYEETSKAFIFSLRNKEQLGPFKSMVKKPSEAIYNHQYVGPSFGRNDIRIDRTEANSSSQLGNSYFVPSAVQNKSTVLAGTHIFLPDEVEVFYLK